MSETVITVEHLAKRYIIGGQRETTDGLRHLLEDATLTPLRWLRGLGKRSRLATSSELSSTREEFWALKDVSFEVQEGEAIAIMRPKRCGQEHAAEDPQPNHRANPRAHTHTRSSIQPPRGRHRISSGTHRSREHLSERRDPWENSASGDQTKVRGNCRFAEIERFLNTPVKRYSSGMYVRLAFAVAAHLEPEIMVVDEVIAVGDAAFHGRGLGQDGNVIEDRANCVRCEPQHSCGQLAPCSKAIRIDNG